MTKAAHIATFKELQCCVLMPTYNNQGTLRRVVQGALAFCDDLIIVNDGSTDDTTAILRELPEVEQLHLPTNQGKGAALRAGYTRAREMGYRHVITIDSDGQHFPEDLPLFLNELKSRPPEQKLLLIGSRNMDQEGVPKKSSFGNRFSNFWYWFETGIRLQDTQSGFRLYPLAPLEKMNFWTTRFEFEIEVIVRLAWEGVVVRNIPIQVHYDPAERVSHFRPVTDFTRISILNTWLILVLFFYIKPRNLYRRFAKKGWRKFVQEDLLGSGDSSEKKALSIALGVFVGITPLWGLHSILSIGLAVAFRLNKALAFAGSNVSIPPMIPFVVIGSIQMGNFLLGQEVTVTMPDDFQDLKLVSHLKVYIIGSLALALLCSAVAGLVTYSFLRARKRSTA